MLCRRVSIFEYFFWDEKKYEPEVYMNELPVSDVEVVTLSQAEIKLVRKRKQSRSFQKMEKRLSP